MRGMRSLQEVHTHGHLFKPRVAHDVHGCKFMKFMYLATIDVHHLPGRLRFVRQAAGKLVVSMDRRAQLSLQPSTDG